LTSAAVEGQDTGIRPESLSTYLASVLARPVQVLGVRRLGATDSNAEDPKELGYGVPLEVECLVDGRPRAFVVSRTRPVKGFGHDYPTDRAWQALYGHHAYNSFPRHVRSLDVGFVREGGDLVSAAGAVEFFQLVEKAEGALYWLDLARMLDTEPRELDHERAIAWPDSSPRHTPSGATSPRSTNAASASWSATASA
jgi:hypothetical protein